MFLECHCTQTDGQFKRKRLIENCPMFIPLTLLGHSRDIPVTPALEIGLLWQGNVRTKLIA